MVEESKKYESLNLKFLDSTFQSLNSIFPAISLSATQNQIILQPQ